MMQKEEVVEMMFLRNGKVNGIQSTSGRVGFRQKPDVSSSTARVEAKPTDGLLDYLVAR